MGEVGDGERWLAKSLPKVIMLTKWDRWEAYVVKFTKLS